MRDKDAIREAMWTALELAGVVRGRSVHDRIPAFHGADEAAQRVFGLDVWQAARVIKSNPDQPQRPLRQRALEEGKTVYMAVPRLRQEQCFVELDPSVIDLPPAKAAAISGAFRCGKLVTVEEMRPVDLVVSGSVAVNRSGTRVGKGGGYADLEYGLAVAAGIVKPTTPVITTVHDMQVLEEDLPSTRHDVPIDYVATPGELIRCSGEMPRPTGIYWDDLDEAKIAQIPVLKMMQMNQGTAPIP
ncbi:MAG: 5-formyltetrahydrofolate cyclo-ligase [Chloroflexi bacterium]|nr:5-formyltetrahydrofolate cyclo-ligase [Chloroflexota bacterium]